MRLVLFLLILPFAVSAQVNKLQAYTGTWVIFKDTTKHDTLCITNSKWLPLRQELHAGQVIYGAAGQARDSCFYHYRQPNTYNYYETDEHGKVTSTSTLTIDGRVWTYHHHIKGSTLWQTLNTFNDSGDEISYQTQRSDDNGKTWVTTRSGKEYRIK